LPDDYIMYRKTEQRGEVPPISTLRVITNEGEWGEQINFIHSGDGPNDNHFVVETDEEHLSIVRFGHDGNGRELAPGATVECRYQFGDPLAGNVGLDTITQLDRNGVSSYYGGELTAPAEILAFQNLMANATVRNPFDVIDGRAPEPMAQVIRNAPEAYRYRQLRAVTLDDYVRRAEEVDGVSRASAAYAWTGSWRTVRITIDPEGTTELTPDLRARVARYLESVRLIGEDLEIRPPRFVPLDVQLALCADPEFWPEDVASALHDEFSDSFTADGRIAFFNPDRFTFGQVLHASEIIGRAQSVTGVEHIISLTMKRWNDPAAPSDAIVNLRPNEIILVASDPDDMERGYMTIDVRGGRR
jgi:predicted phage baseplate assembly protein